MSERPVVFISHSSHDKMLADELKRQIECCLDNVTVFAATIDPGENWFDKVIEYLNEADAFILLITPNSVEQSHWVWFELGYFWSRHNDSLTSLEKRKTVYYPLYVNGTELPNPVKDLQIQATSLNDTTGVMNFFEQLCRHFGSGDIEKVNTEAIAQKAKSQDEIRIDSAPDILNNWRG